MNKPAHESAAYHVTGEAVYIDDMNINEQLLFGKVYYSPFAKATIKSVNSDKARSLKGVYAILNYKDIPGKNQMGPVIHDEVVLAEKKVQFIGQAILLIAAESEKIANKAISLIEIEFEEEKPIITIEDAIEKGDLLQPQRKIECGNVEKGFKECDYIIEGQLKTGAQEHWYLETQVCVSVPGEGNSIMVFSSTQNPTETQLLIAEALSTRINDVEVQVRRMGGAFGGKETQGNHVAIWSALLAKHTKRPVKIKLFRDDDQIMTGKRHPYLFNYKVGFSKEGFIKTYEVEMNANGGSSTDLSMAILERALFHAENSYFIPNAKIIGKVWKTNLPSNTAFRGFGGPQGMACIEQVIDQIARKLQIDASEIRFRNFYGLDNNNITPYGQTIENNRLFLIWEKLFKLSDYEEQRKKINRFNQTHEFVKQGMALTPVKFGISFTTAFLNQAGALVNIYKDGTVLVNHGGTEMGQGLFTKMQQIAALELGINLEKVSVNATNTSKVPNTSPTAASSGTDMNGMAIKNAVSKLKNRISEVIAKELSKTDNRTYLPENIEFKGNMVFDSKIKSKEYSFVEAINLTYLNRVSLSATGFYKTPSVHFNRKEGKGHPFYYFAFGMSVSMVELDLLTGHHTVLRTNILHDAGKSINERIDLGQIEGGFIQGLGWCTTEDIKWDNKGNLLNHSPDTYKIPGIGDIPNDFRVELLKDVPNSNTIRQSKAVGEPPFMLAFSVWLAIKDAISAVGNHKYEPKFSLPATNEVILLSLEDLKNQMKNNEK